MKTMNGLKNLPSLVTLDVSENKIKEFGDVG
jgi:Leucine-rich repeat (LRR) protein